MPQRGSMLGDGFRLAQPILQMADDAWSRVPVVQGADRPARLAGGDTVSKMVCSEAAGGCPPEIDDESEDVFAEMQRERDARTRHERHGEGELTSFDDAPIRATGCRLPDGTFTDAECLLPHAPIDDDKERVWARRLPGTPIRRRGRLTVKPSNGLFFTDEIDADLVPASSEEEPALSDLDRDLGQSARICGLVRSDLFATLLYGALCNSTWRHNSTGVEWSCSWRSAGAVVAHLRGEGDYLDWYCAGGEGLADDQVLAEIELLGWALAKAEPSG